MSIAIHERANDATAALAAWSPREGVPTLDVVADGEHDYRLRLGKAIVQLRAMRGISQSSLAELVNRSEAAVSRWETGKVTPSAYDLVQLAAALDAPPPLLLDPPELPVSPVAELLRRVAEQSADFAIDEALDAPPDDAAPEDRRPPSRGSRRQEGRPG